MREIMVYFVNNCKVRMDPDRTVFDDKGDLFTIGRVRFSDDPASIIASGGNIVNWDSVAYVRQMIDLPDDD